MTRIYHKKYMETKYVARFTFLFIINNNDAYKTPVGGKNAPSVEVLYEK